MDNYARITRDGIAVDPTAARFMGEARSVRDWSDKMLDLILNGPTIMGIKKDEIRAMLRESYAALNSYEQIGPMASPFVNDPAAIVAGIFSGLYPDVKYRAQLVLELADEGGKAVYAETFFPDDGSDPIISIAANSPIGAMAEIFAHELAHIVAGYESGHGERWEAVMDQIHDEYEKAAVEMAAEEEPETFTIAPHQVGDGGILAMPLKANIPNPKHDDWKLITCPVCGAECWQTDIAREALAAEPELRAACTTCALKAGLSRNGGPGSV